MDTTIIQENENMIEKDKINNKDKIKELIKNYKKVSKELKKIQNQIKKTMKEDIKECNNENEITLTYLEKYIKIRFENAIITQDEDNEWLIVDDNISSIIDFIEKFCYPYYTIDIDDSERGSVRITFELKK